mmetsp:Transcript_2376/g.5939  ORF Transcript_2376/g.5939 Transcript_2376/m.5939 type:complete len:136 (-) Transcript_2376:192-599(-)
MAHPRRATPLVTLAATMALAAAASTVWPLLLGAPAFVAGPRAAQRSAQRLAQEAGSFKQRSPNVARSFFGSEPPPKPKKEEFTGFLGAVNAVDQYTKVGSKSLKGPLAGVPWVTVIFFVALSLFINYAFVEGGKA